MTRRRTITLLTLIAITTALLVAGLAVAKPTRTSFMATEVVGYGSPEKFWIEGNVLHIRNQQNTNAFICTDDRVAGTNYVVVNVDVNLATGDGTWHAETVLVPDAVDGTWEISGHGKFLWGTGASGNAIGHGTGGLEGLKIVMSWPINGPITGYIFDPHGE